MTSARIPGEDPARALLERATGLMREGQTAASIPELREAIRLAPDSSWAHWLLARALCETGAGAEAAEQYCLAFQLWHPSYPEFVEFCLDLEDAKLRRAAISVFRVAASTLPDPSLFHCVLGLALAHEGRFEEGEAECWKAVKLAPNLFSEFVLVRALELAGKWNKAMLLYRACSDAKPARTRARRSPAVALMGDWQVDTVTREYRQRIRLEPDRLEWRFKLASVFEWAGRLDEAIATYGAIVQREPRNARGHRRLGGVLLGAGREEEAGAAFKEAIRLDPADVEWAREQGGILLAACKPGAAAVVFGELVRAAPEDLELRHRLAVAFLRMGRIDEGTTIYRDLIRRAPEDLNWHLELGLALELVGARDAAIGIYQEIIDLIPDDRIRRENNPELARWRADAHHYSGSILRAKGELQRALAHLYESVRLTPEDGEGRLELGQALNEAGRRAEARAEWEKALTLGDEEIVEEARQMLDQYLL